MMLAASGLTTATVRAGEYDDGQSVKYYETFKGKKVVLIVISSGMDIAQGLAAGLTRQAQDMGYDISVRDYNWNNDQGAQAISLAIAEKPDVLVVQNLDMQAYASLFKRDTATPSSGNGGISIDGRPLAESIDSGYRISVGESRANSERSAETPLSS